MRNLEQAWAHYSTEVLGAILVDPDRGPELLTGLADEAFPVGCLRSIAVAVREMLRRGEAVAVETVRGELERTGRWAQVGDEGMDRVRYAVTSSARATRMREELIVCARVIKLLAFGRELVATESEDLATNEARLALIDQAQREVLEATSGDDSAAPRAPTVEDGMPVDEEAEGKRSLGAGQLDALLHPGGLAPGRLVAVAARPGAGKSLLTMGSAASMALSEMESGNPRPILVISAEMSVPEVMRRLSHAVSGVPQKGARKNYSPDELDKLQRAAERVAELPLRVLARRCSMAEIEGHARSMYGRVGLGGLVIDYLQILRPEEGRTRTEEIGRMSGALKGLALDLQVPVLTAVQLSRKADDHDTPHLGDIRESGSIEQDADAVVALVNSARQVSGDHKEREKVRGTVKALVLKARGGRCGEVDLTFDGAKARLGDWWNGLADPVEVEAFSNIIPSQAQETRRDAAVETQDTPF